MSPVDDIRAFVEKQNENGWRDNPILVPTDELAERARRICKENHIPAKIEVVKAKWKKK